MSDERLKKRVQPFVALRAMRQLLKDKEDTAQVFRIVEALAGNSHYTTFTRFCESDGGQEILARRLNLIDALRDREALAALPEGSLGRAYLDFVYGEGLTADGLVDASEDGAVRHYKDEDAQLYRDRMRDSHDLWHVVTGYGRDGLGELCVLTFGNAQMYNRGIAFIVMMGLRKTRREQPQLPARAAIREARQRGRKAGWLPGIVWEDWLALPLEEVRARLDLEEPATYRAAEAESKRIEAQFQAQRGGTAQDRAA